MKKSLIVLLLVVAGTFLCGNALAFEAYIPHITGGETGWTDYLQANNNTSSSANFTLTLYSGGNQIYSNVFSVGGLSRSQIQLKALHPSAETGVITYAESGLVFRVSYNNIGGGIAEFKAIDTLGSNVGLYFSDFTSFVQWKGAAIANMGSTQADVTLYAIGGGAILGTHTATINPKDKIVGIHSAWFSSLNLSQVESIIAVTGSSSLCGIAIGGDVAQTRLLFTPATPVINFNPPTQADLTGTWNIQILTAGSSNRWMRFVATIDSAGFLTLLSFLDSAGNTGLPPANSIQWTIDSNGVISESGVNAVDQVHMTMTSNKNFIAGTGSDNLGRQLRVIQKMVPGTVYSNADVQNMSFVSHQLTLGSNPRWSYGTGTFDATGAVTIISSTNPDGTVIPGAAGATISVDGNGVVTITGGMDNYRGFLSDDKKTIVGTYTVSAHSEYTLMIIQIAGRTYTAGPFAARTSANHYLACGAAPAPFWIHYTTTVVSDGVLNFSDWVSSNPAITVSPSRTGSITSSGAISIAEIPSFHGQVSDDGMFTVSTQTGGTSPNFIYGLSISTR